jgi:putative transposase
MSYAADKSGGQFEILIMEIDPAKSDHIHFLIKYVPDCPISKIVHDLKQYSTYHLWKLHASYLKKFFWSKRLLWTRGYFVSTIGEVSEKTIRNYIEKQG